MRFQCSQEIVSVIRKEENQEISCTKHIESCPQFCHHFDYLPVVIARFQKAVTDGIYFPI